MRRDSSGRLKQRLPGIDGEEGGDETIVYDNVVDQPLSGGSIIIHQKK